jgi:hypothetical protein
MPENIAERDNLEASTSPPHPPRPNSDTHTTLHPFNNHLIHKTPPKNSTLNST